MDPEMFEDDIVSADALEAWGEHCEPYIPNSEVQESDLYNPEHDLYHDRYDDDPNPYHGTYSEE